MDVVVSATLAIVTSNAAEPFPSITTASLVVPAPPLDTLTVPSVRLPPVGFEVTTPDWPLVTLIVPL